MRTVMTSPDLARENRGYSVEDGGHVPNVVLEEERRCHGNNRRNDGELDESGTGLGIGYAVDVVHIVFS